MGRFLIAITATIAITTPIGFSATAADLPDTIAAKGETVVVQVHAVGAQIYECKADASGKTIWQFREPIAALFLDGKTVGVHHAGPTWDIGGSAVVGKVTGRAPGATAKDIPWLKLDTPDRRGDGLLKDVATVQRINTTGGTLEGSCEKVGDLHAEPYVADYIFLKK